MDFDLSPEQSLLKESVGKLLADHYTFEQRKAYAQSADGFSREMWDRYAEQGLLGLPFAEAQGGFGAGPVETMIVMEAMGGALTLEPYWSSVVLAGGLLRAGASEAQLRALVPRIAAGEVFAFAHAEREARYDLAHVGTRARRVGGEWRLDGEKSLVLAGDSAETFVVSARISGEPRDRNGMALFLVAGSAPGLARRAYPTQDGRRAAEISLVSVVARDVVGEPGACLALIERVADEALAALAAEAVGAMAVLTDMTVDYLKTRRQFGVPIGSFQVLQHRAADMLIALEQARSMALFATMMAEEPDAGERRKSLAAAKVQIGRSAKLVAQHAIQLHGGMGMTMEYMAGHYMKRLAMIETMLGDTEHHLRALARAGALI
ncbi:MAG TPA: acyl-CoA dehydrogenase family protein [Stellaceae bacterium]|nr:acyl-CoA dehydrogenase family protein [Stellaceae bacterium]